MRGRNEQEEKEEVRRGAGKQYIKEVWKSNRFSDVAPSAGFFFYSLLLDLFLREQEKKILEQTNA